MKKFMYIFRRIALLIPLVLLISIATFSLVRMLPGDPAQLQLGPFATEEAVRELRKEMRLDEPIVLQYFAYLERLSRGDFGRSWVNATEVSEDLRIRFPATLELIMYTFLVIVIILIPLGVYTSIPGGGFLKKLIKKITFVYSAIAGALPDFWLALIFIYILFTKLAIAPGPVGRLSIMSSPPTFITGMYTIDAFITGDYEVLYDAIKHLILPVLTLAAVYGAAIYKITRTTMTISLSSNYAIYAEGFGLPKLKIIWYVFRNATLPVITMTGIVTGYLLGAAVLVETVFNFNGIGRYALQSIVTADYAPIQAFVLIASVFTITMYLVVDLIYFASDPRVRVEGN